MPWADSEPQQDAGPTRAEVMTEKASAAAAAVGTVVVTPP